jgi:hypothetical protein
MRRAAIAGRVGVSHPPLPTGDERRPQPAFIAGNYMFQDSHLVVTSDIHDMASTVTGPNVQALFRFHRIMLNIFKSSFVWQFAGGFVLGAIGLVALQPAAATHEMLGHFAPTHEVR